ncbi:hypothetical protein FHT82_005577 [Rhizobium sp. BK275]|nr:hypothetical protein [Rhizobium sp. BK275]MBB3392788.1 hypothetical protein [Rhizobium sp. BK275]
MKDRGLPSPNEGDTRALTSAQKPHHRAGTGVKAAVDYDVYG